jgi:hypothetical protein
VSAIDAQGRTIWIVDAHRDDGKRFVLHAEEKLSAFFELEAAIRGSSRFHASMHCLSDTAQAQKRRTKVS